MTETLKLWIVSLFPLPFTPVNVFFVLLAGAISHVFSQALPLGSPGLPTTNLRARAAGGLGSWNANWTCLWLCLSAQPQFLQPEQRASAVEVAQACLQLAHLA